MYIATLAADKVIVPIRKPGVTAKQPTAFTFSNAANPPLKSVKGLQAKQLSLLQPPAAVLKAMSPALVKAVSDTTGTLPPAAKIYSLVTGAAASKPLEAFTAITETPAAIPGSTTAISTIKDFYAKNPVVVYAAGGVLVLLLLSSFKKKGRR